MIDVKLWKEYSDEIHKHNIAEYERDRQEALKHHRAVDKAKKEYDASSWYHRMTHGDPQWLDMQRSVHMVRLAPFIIPISVEGFYSWLADRESD